MVYTIRPIGFVRNSGLITDCPGQLKMLQSRIEVDELYREGLTDITRCGSLLIIFGFHKITEVHQKESLLLGGETGIFACRSQFRPNHLGVTYCKLESCEDLTLTVRGLDAADGSPVYDIKCPDTSELELQLIHDTEYRKNPRNDINYAIRNNLAYSLWLKAAQLTGELSADLALGVMVGLHFMRELRRLKQVANDYTITFGTCSSLVDSVCFVTGINNGSGRVFIENRNSDNSIRTFNVCFKSASATHQYSLCCMPSSEQDPSCWIKEDISHYFNYSFL